MARVYRRPYYTEGSLLCIHLDLVCHLKAPGDDNN